MKMSKKNDCLNELLKGKTAAKNSYFEFITAILAVILICIQDEMFSFKQSFQRVYKSGWISVKMKSCTYQKILEYIQFLLDNRISVLSGKDLTRVQECIQINK